MNEHEWLACEDPAAFCRPWTSLIRWGRMSGPGGASNTTPTLTTTALLAQEQIMAEIKATSDRPFFQPRPECDDFQTAYLLWKIAGALTVSPAGCWEWQGVRIRNGYGRIGYGKKDELVHRLVYRLCVADLPVSVQVCHRCDNPPCLNLSHLFAGTCSDNVNDAVSKGRNYVPCPKGGRKARKLSDDDVRAIRARADAGEKTGQLAKEFHVSPSVITSVVRRHRYRSVADHAAGDGHG